MSANIDQLTPTKILIDLTSHSDNDFGLSEYDLTGLYDDLILAEYTDETPSGDIIRGGIVVPANTIQRAWRVGRVVLAGMGCKNVAAGDLIIFPHDKGIPISGITVEGHGDINHGIFLNEERLFGKCKPKNESSDTDS